MHKENNSKKTKKRTKHQPHRVNRGTVIYVGVIIIVTLAVYSPAFKGTFLNWDDDTMVTDNYLIKNLTTESIGHIFSRPVLGSYNPLVILLFALEKQVFGLSPFAFHAINIFVHILNSLLVFWLVLLICRNKIGEGGARTVALFTALLFSVHPTHVEAVAWVTALKETLSTFFYLSSIAAYLFFVKKGKPATYVFSLVLFVFSVLSKPVAVTLPGVLVLLDFYTAGKFDKIALLNKIPFVIISLVFSYVAFLTFGENNSIVSAFGVLDSLLIFLYGLFFYLYKLCLPINLAHLYPIPVKTGSWLPSIYYFAPLILLGLAFLASRLRTYKKEAVFATVFFLVTILPVSNLIPVKNASLFFDRFTYIPYLGFFYFVCFFLYEMFVKGSVRWRGSKLIIKWVSIALIFVLAFASYQRASVWKDGFTLWTDAIEKFPENSKSYGGRAEWFYLNGEVSKSVSDYNTAISLDFENANFLNERGNVYRDVKEYDKAMINYGKALTLEPVNWSVYNNMGMLFTYQKKFDEALHCYNKSILYKPDYTLALCNIGNLYYETQKYDSSIAAYNRAIKSDNYLPIAYVGRGLCYYKKNMYGDAVENFLKVIAIDPDDEKTYQKLTYNYFLEKDYSNAWKYVNLMKRKNYALDRAFINQLEKESGGGF